MMNLTESLKYVVYRAPIVSRLMAPTYPYKINPGQLATMIELIDNTRTSGGAVVEIGVAQGDSSVFFLEHLETTADPRPLLLFDTFSGFTPESIDVEVDQRGKHKSEYDKFRYGDEAKFRRNLANAGYHNFSTYRGDAAKFDWTQIGPVGAVLLDIDLYKPTLDILNAIYPLLVSGGGIVVDDCIEGGPWDGSLQAYQEFIAEKGLPSEIVGRKGGVVRKA
jgi:hypothetical protein